MCLASYNAFGITWDALYEGIESRRKPGLMLSESDFEAYGLDKLHEECKKGKEESCFVLEKLLQKEVAYFLNIAMEIQMSAKNLQELKKCEIELLKRVECDSVNIDCFKRYVVHRIKEVRNKYKRLQERYPNKPKQSYIKTVLFGPQYDYMTEHQWWTHLQFYKRSCNWYGYTGSCVELQKMKKK